MRGFAFIPDCLCPPWQTNYKLVRAPSNFLLLADDDDEDALLLQRALKKMPYQIPNRRVRDGEELIAYLRGEGQYANREEFPFPNTLLIDLKMPRKGGFEVLEWLKAHPKCCVIPTIIWSSSQLPADVQRAYEMGANAYLVKPGSFDELRDMLEKMLAFWALCTKPHVPPSCGENT